MLLKVELGCGDRKREGYFGLDRKKIQGVDIICDFNKKLPLKNSSVDTLYTAHTIEYVKDLDHIFSEIHRICKKDAVVEIIVPHFSSYTAYHCNASWIFRWYEGLGDYCISEHNHLGKQWFKIIHSEIRLENHFKWLNGIINKMPRLYERTFLKALFPAYEIYFKLQVIKKM